MKLFTPSVPEKSGSLWSHDVFRIEIAGVWIKLAGGWNNFSGTLIKMNCTWTNLSGGRSKLTRTKMNLAGAWIKLSRKTYRSVISRSYSQAWLPSSEQNHHRPWRRVSIAADNAFNKDPNALICISLAILDDQVILPPFSSVLDLVGNTDSTTFMAWSRLTMACCSIKIFLCKRCDSHIRREMQRPNDKLRARIPASQSRHLRSHIFRLFQTSQMSSRWKCRNLEQQICGSM